VHLLRAQVDAVVTGVGTVLADDPQLAVRTLPTDGSPLGPTPVTVRQPLRVVLDGDGRTPPDARIHDDAALTLVLTAADVGAWAGGHGVDLHAALALLHQRQVRSVLLECGATLAGAFVDTGLVDRVVAYLAPALLGQGPAALSTGDVGRSIGGSDGWSCRTSGWWATTSGWWRPLWTAGAVPPVQPPRRFTTPGRTHRPVGTPARCNGFPGVRVNPRE
jgi:riboflavin biosynthesis pyrimidine reductase